MKKDTSNHQLSIKSQKSNFLLYTANEGKITIEVFLKNIFEAGELEEKSVISILETTASDGKTYNTRFYKSLQ